MSGGNYTCHLSSNGEYLNHTVILVQLDPDNRTVILEEKSPEEGEIRMMERMLNEDPGEKGEMRRERETKAKRCRFSFYLPRQEAFI